MISQMKQVVLTYLTQQYLWLAVGFFAMIIVPNILTVGRSSGRAGFAMMFALGMPVMMLTPFLVGHVKMQFGHSRARLMPQFMRAHLAVLGGVLLLTFVIYPLGLAALSNINPLGILAAGLAIGAPAIWGAQLNRFAPMLVSMGVFYSLMTTWGMNWWFEQAAAHRPAHALTIAAGAVLVVAWLWRLSTLREEMPDYLNAYQAMLARRTGSESVEQRRVVASAVGRNKLTSRIGDWWHARLGGYYGGTKEGLARLLRYGYGPMPMEAHACFMLAMFVALGIFMSQFSFTQGARGPGIFGALWFFAMFGILMPGQMAGELLAQRRPRLSYEMLLPVPRRQLIEGLFAAAARNTISTWVIMNLGLALLVAIAKVELNAWTVVQFVLMSAVATFVSMAIGLRLAVWPSMIKRLIVVYVSWMVLIAPVFGLWAVRDKLGDWPVLLMTGILLAVGALVFSHARRAWFALELG